MSDLNHDSNKGPFLFAQVLWDELRHLQYHNGSEPTPSLKQIYQRIATLAPEKTLSALCFSGGGIRSATFNLGVIQALAKLGLLGRFDYLSSVSGGGYIAGWLKAWLNTDGPVNVAAALAEPAKGKDFDPLAPEPKPIDHLREYSNYLTPRVGFFSPDTWTAAALIVRNLILNWLVLIPGLAAFVAIPQGAFIIAAGSPRPCGGSQNPVETWGWVALLIAFALALWASVAVYAFRRQRSTEATILRWAVLPLWLSCLSLSCAGLWLCVPSYSSAGLLVFCLLWCTGIPLAGWLLALATIRPVKKRPPWRSELWGIVLSGLVATVLLFVMARFWLPPLEATPLLFVILAVPILLGLYLLARALFVAFASIGESDKAADTGEIPSSELANEDREWWGRLSGWILLLAAVWLGTSALVLLGNHVLERYAHSFLTHAVAAAGGISGLITALLGASPRTQGRSDSTATPPSRSKELLLSLLAPLTAASIILLLSRLVAWTARATTGHNELLRLSTLDERLALVDGWDLTRVFLLFVLVPSLFLAASWLLGWVVNVNRFSAHGLYRNRLVRAYLGASNRKRQPDTFTGFDPSDNMPLYRLSGGASPRPLPVVNVTLNLVKSAEKLAWQQRKAESFSMTPLYCGNFHEGYRRSRDYGGPNGISLGTAMTISGAAANPSAGYHSSPIVTFLMALFNVRLGCWLGNTNKCGEAVYPLPGPGHAWMSLFAELFGFTDASHPYVNLSDGGHFENLGVYEMVLRRCRYIVVSDAGQDLRHDFEDLGNLIRKVRIDFGIPIQFAHPINILPRTENGPGVVMALGTIKYDVVDPGTQPGWLLYIKPTLRAGGQAIPYDVFSYYRSSKAFPHEPTADQWFSEAQFESYRALGEHLAEKLGGKQGVSDLPDLFNAAQELPEQTAGTPLSSG